MLLKARIDSLPKWLPALLPPRRTRIREWRVQRGVGAAHGVVISMMGWLSVNLYVSRYVCLTCDAALSLHDPLYQVIGAAVKVLAPRDKSMRIQRKAESVVSSM